MGDITRIELLADIVDLALLSIRKDLLSNDLCEEMKIRFKALSLELGTHIRSKIDLTCLHVFYMV